MQNSGVGHVHFILLDVIFIHAGSRFSVEYGLNCNGKNTVSFMKLLVHSHKNTKVYLILIVKLNNMAVINKDGDSLFSFDRQLARGHQIYSSFWCFFLNVQLMLVGIKMLQA